MGNIANLNMARYTDEQALSKILRAMKRTLKADAFCDRYKTITWELGGTATSQNALATLSNIWARNVALGDKAATVRHRETTAVSIVIGFPKTVSMRYMLQYLVTVFAQGQVFVERHTVELKNSGNHLFFRTKQMNTSSANAFTGKHSSQILKTMDIRDCRHGHGTATHFHTSMRRNDVVNYRLGNNDVLQHMSDMTV